MPNHRSRLPRPLTAGLAAASLLAATAGWLTAAAQAEAATLKVSVSGTQTTTWKYTKQQAPTCDWPEFEDGKQTITLATKKPVKVKVSAGKGGKLSFSSAAFEVPAKAELRRSYDRRFAQQSPCDGGGIYGGDGPAPNVTGEATCSSQGAVELRLGTARDQLYAADEAKPAGAAPKAKAGSALLRGAPKWKATGSWPFLPAACSDTGQPDADIAITEGRGEYSGAIIEAAAALPVKALLKAKKGAKTVRVKTSVDYPNADQPQPGKDATTGRTVLDLKLTLSR